VVVSGSAEPEPEPQQPVEEEQIGEEREGCPICMTPLPPP
jgi:hypothetical protein